MDIKVERLGLKTTDLKVTSTEIRHGSSLDISILDALCSSTYRKKTFHLLRFSFFLFFFALSLKIKNCFLSLVFHLENSKHTLRIYPLINFPLPKKSSSQQQHYNKQPLPVPSRCHKHLRSTSTVLHKAFDKVPLATKFSCSHCLEDMKYNGNQKMYITIIPQHLTFVNILDCLAGSRCYPSSGDTTVSLKFTLFRARE